MTRFSCCFFTFRVSFVIFRYMRLALMAPFYKRVYLTIWLCLIYFVVNFVRLVCFVLYKVCCVSRNTCLLCCVPVLQLTPFVHCAPSIHPSNNYKNGFLRPAGHHPPSSTSIWPLWRSCNFAQNSAPEILREISQLSYSPSGRGLNARHWKLKSEAKLWI